MTERIVRLACRLLLSVLALGGQAWAATYTLPAASFAPCKGSWSSAQNTCSAEVILQAGDVVTAATALTISAEAGFKLNGNNTLGSTGSRLSLASTYGSVVVGAGSTLHGAIATTTGEVSLTSTHVLGAVSGSGKATFIDSRIDGAVQRNNGITGSNTVFGSTIAVSNGTLTLSGGRVLGNITINGNITLTNVEVLGTITSTNGAIRLTGGSVAGKVTTPCCTVTTDGTDLHDGVTARSGISITGGTIAGDFYMTANNSISISGATMTRGSIEAWNVDISGSQIGSAGAPTVTVANGNWLNVLNGSVVYGSLTVDNTYGKLTIDASSRVYGTCRAESKPNTNNNVIGICSPLPAASVNHYRLSYTSQALTCQPHAIQVTACANESCSEIYTEESSSLTVSPGGSPFGFTGSGTATIAIRSAQSVSLSVTGASPAFVNPTLCSIDGGAFSSACPLNFAEAGLLLEAPDLIAGKEGELSITAVRQSDKSAVCVPAFAGVAREVAFWSRYVDPDASRQVGNRAVQLDGTALSFDEASPTPRPLTFDAGGKARVALRYDDAGKMQLEARYAGTAANGDEGLVMRGADQFVSRPYGLYLEADALAGCSAPGADCAPYAGGAVRAGDSFAMRARAKAWTVEEERTADNLRDNPDTPNYQQAGIVLSHEVLAPAGGVAASDSAYGHALGEQTSFQHAVDEVGIFTVVATPPSYLGSDMGHALSRSAAVGRFVPAYLEVEGTVPQLAADSCSDPTSGLGFAYQGQPIEFAESPAFTVTGMNRSGGITHNYDRGGFWKLDSGFVHDYRFGSNDLAVHDNERLSVSGSFTPEVSGDDDGDGARTYRLEGESLIYARSTGEPLASDAPFTPYLDLTLAADQLQDRDGVCYTAGDRTPGAPCRGFAVENFGFASAASEIRLGRVRLENVIAPDVAAAGASHPQAQLPLQIEHWGSSGFQAAADTCTTVEELPAQRRYSGNLSGVEVGSHAGGFVPVEALAGSGGRLDGSVTLSFDLKSVSGGVALPASWLCLPSATDALASGGVCSSYSGGARGAASATFGIYRGPAPLIFRRELYR